MSHTHTKTSGFTLIEVLIAISIFSIIGLASFYVLDTITQSQSKIETHQDATRKLERAMHIISADFEQLVYRPVRGNYADNLTAFSSPHEGYLIEFTRQGWRNPLDLPRSQLQRVAYELGNIEGSEGGPHLLRHYWAILDRAEDSAPTTQLLLQNVNDVQARFLTSGGKQVSEWPILAATNETPENLPTGIILDLYVAGTGQIQRTFQLSEATALNNSPNSQITEQPEDEDELEDDFLEDEEEFDEEDDFDDEEYDDWEDEDYDDFEDSEYEPYQNPSFYSGETD